ncbi:E3 ubiquitin-protein ligase UPL6-like isoform X3 [Gossypium arboreum]|uniref:E3 ubiquitin-protein ligase UPL6-like isoform X3 n=1 Tax=Gossypium arboreum TaxID=29729 RepID=UPI000818FD43|nr:E3 ubiquitin-protein ligase UPL6-like isoform X3 [Gossypium arboreum]
MFFTGDPTTRKRVDLGSQSSKERDRQKLLKQTRLERNRCLWLCQQNSAALKIQKYFRRGKVVEVERAKVREQFYKTYGKHGHHVDRHCFGPDLEFLRQLIFFVNAWNMNDFSVLAEICRLIQHFVPRKWGCCGTLCRHELLIQSFFGCLQVEATLICLHSGYISQQWVILLVNKQSSYIQRVSKQ